jgi:hypothetical protein
MPTVEATATIAMVAAARGAGRWSRAVAIMSGVSPSPTPCAARPTNSSANGTGSTVSTLPPTTTASVASTTRRRPGPDPSRPSTGVAIAPASNAIVNVHWAAASDTSNAPATAVTKATNTIVGARARGPLIGIALLREMDVSGVSAPRNPVPVHLAGATR